MRGADYKDVVVFILNSLDVPKIMQIMRFFRSAFGALTIFLTLYLSFISIGPMMFSLIGIKTTSRYLEKNRKKIKTHAWDGCRYRQSQNVRSCFFVSTWLISLETVLVLLYKWVMVSIEWRKWEKILTSELERVDSDKSISNLQSRSRGLVYIL